jgi:proteasome lid subunit RPN8/RPN11
VDDLFEWGTPHDDQSPSALGSDRARRVAAACEANSAFHIVEYRYCDRPGVGRCDVIVVRCTNQEVPNRNAVGIRIREPLALTVPIDDGHPPEVRALRIAFPMVPHLNAVPEGEPKWLCLFVEAWSAARRNWTPQRFLALVLWWLKETANRTLHRPEQPVERAYLDGGGEIVLPAGYTGQEPPNTRLIVNIIPHERGGTLVANYSTDADVTELPYVPVYLRVDRVHGVIDQLPLTLGALVDQWSSRGVLLADMLIDRLAGLAGGGQIDVVHQAVVLILDIAVMRVAGGPVERREPIGFLIQQSVVSLAYAMGAVHRQGGFLYYAPSERNPSVADDTAADWRSIMVLAMDVKAGLTRAAARAQAGLDHEGADAERVLVGAGALGSALADIWAREAWGRWTHVDPDHVQPHNLVRHRAVYAQVGRYKVDVIKELTDAIYSPGYASITAIAASATATDNDALTTAFRAADLIVDVTTTLDVPRELSAREGAPRMVSAFLTPSGGASVLLLEDQERSIPLHCIEPQYYRMVLRNSWGQTHLAGHAGYVVVGGGCRDVSTVMSPETVELHAAILARQIRTLTARSDAAIKVWIAAEDGGVVLHSTAVRAVHRFESGSWQIVLDDEVIENLLALRAARAPKETGGIIAGYTDHVTRTIYVVDVLPAPPDSVEEEDVFVRGADRLHEEWRQIQDKTASIVTYVGEWHSHPPQHGATPSWEDMSLVAHLGQVLAHDGEPALMMIIAESEFSMFVCEADRTSARISVAGLSR